MNTLDAVVEKAKQLNNPVVAIASAADLEVLEAVSLSIQKGLASFILFDDEQKIHQLINDNFQHLRNESKISIRHTDTAQNAATEAVKAVSSKSAQVLMKGNLSTSIILKAVLHKEYGLRAGKILSHVAVFEVNGYDKLLFVTDAGMNIHPDLETKAQIIRNAVDIAHACGVLEPIVTPLAAIETINPIMTATMDAAALVMMNRRGQITGCVIEGPLALDNAISVEAAKLKGISSDMAGKADILVVPNIESGNILYKSLVYFGNAKVGAMIQGAASPIVLTSRSDSAESKLYSLALALLSTIDKN